MPLKRKHFIEFAQLSWLSNEIQCHEFEHSLWHFLIIKLKLDKSIFQMEVCIKCHGAFMPLR